MGFLLALGAVLGGTRGLPADDVTDIVITEIMYHPASNDRRDEFIELYNMGTVAYNFAGFHFTSGLNFTFPDTTLDAGQYLVVCANQSRIRPPADSCRPAGDR